MFDFNLISINSNYLRNLDMKKQRKRKKKYDDLISTINILESNLNQSYIFIFTKIEQPLLKYNFGINYKCFGINYLIKEYNMLSKPIHKQLKYIKKVLEDNDIISHTMRFDSDRYCGYVITYEDRTHQEFINKLSKLKDNKRNDITHHIINADKDLCKLQEIGKKILLKLNKKKKRKMKKGSEKEW